jgi:hypothetical protein
MKTLELKKPSDHQKKDVPEKGHPFWCRMMKYEGIRIIEIVIDEKYAILIPAHYLQWGNTLRWMTF